MLKALHRHLRDELRGSSNSGQHPSLGSDDQRGPDIRTAGSVFSKAAAGFVSPLFRNSSCVWTRLDGSVCVWVVSVAVSDAQPEKNRALTATRPRAKW